MERYINYVRDNKVFTLDSFKCDTLESSNDLIIAFKMYKKDIECQCIFISKSPTTSWLEFEKLLIANNTPYLKKQ